MRTFGLIFVGYLILFPHLFYSWRDWFETKGKKTSKERRKLLWNFGLTTLMFILLMALTVEGFGNEFSLRWTLYLSAIVVLFLFWSMNFLPESGRGRT